MQKLILLDEEKEIIIEALDTYYDQLIDAINSNLNMPKDIEEDIQKRIDKTQDLIRVFDPKGDIA